MKRLTTFIAALVLISSLWPTVTVAQQSQQTMPPNTVICRLGISPGPGQACPFSVFFSSILSSIFAPGVDTNTLNVLVANHTIDLTECAGTIEAGTGSTGQFTLTLPAVAGFPLNCSVLIKNADTTNAKLLAGFPADMGARLWPLQSVGVKIVNGAWQTFYNPGRWRLTAPVTWYVGAGVPAPCGTSGQFTGANQCAAGNDANDGLTPATAWASGQNGINIVEAEIDARQFAPTIDFAHGAYTAAMACTGGALVGQIVMVLEGDTTNQAAVQLVAPNSSQALTVKDGCGVKLQSIYIADQGSAVYGVSYSQDGILDFGDVFFGQFNSGAAQILGRKTGSADISNPPGSCAITLAGGAGSFLKLTDSAVFGFETEALSGAGQNVCIPSAVAYSNGFINANGGSIHGLSSSTFTGSGVAGTTGVRAILKGPVWVGANATTLNSVLPGNAAAQLTQGAQDDANDNQTSPMSVGGVSCPSGITAGTVTVVSGVVTHC